MSTSSDASLGAIRQAAQEVSDNENNGAISTPAWNQFITNSYKELYDMLISAYGNDYHVAIPYQFLTTNAQSYSLPDGTATYTDTTGSTAAKFYKMLGVDLQYSATPSGFISLKRFEMIDRNKYGFPNTQTTWVGYTNLRYRIQGNNLFIVPIPQTGQTVKLWYAPAPTNLQFRLQGGLTGSSPVVTLNDTTGLSAGMNIQGNAIPDNTTISIVGTTSVIMSSNALTTLSSNLVSMWTDTTVIDGISGWEEYVIVDAAMKSQNKIENDASPLYQRKMDLKARIEAMAEARDAGQAFHVSDVMGGTCWTGDGWGIGGGGFGGGWGDW